MFHVKFERRCCLSIASYFTGATLYQMISLLITINL